MTYTKLDFDASRVSDDLKRLNPGVFGPSAAKPRLRLAQLQVQIQEPEGQPPRLAQCNKTERRFYDWLCSQHPADRIVIQPPRHFPLKGGGTYTPDFLVYADSGVFAYEVKGGYRGPGAEQGHERYARAAAQWASANLHFCKATWRDRQWRLEPWPSH